VGPALSRRQLLTACGELALAILIFLAVNIFHVLPVSEAIWVFLLGWVSLRLRGTGWHAVGLVRPARWGRVLLIAALAALMLQLLSTYVTEPIITSMTGATTDLSRFRPLVGNVPLLLGGLLVVWTLAAFGEELTYRGYILNRAADLGGRRPAAWIAGLVSVSLLFGMGHLYQGPTGVADTTISGLLLGGLYLTFDRNLWIPILAHGFTDTIALFLVFFDLVPGVYR
jgi:membrane protease YdiL (CAAX protease family)